MKRIVLFMLSVALTFSLISTTGCKKVQEETSEEIPTSPEEYTPQEAQPAPDEATPEHVVPEVPEEK